MAGVSTKDIKNRIRSMESTRQITKAMEMVASSKLRQAQTRVLNARPYFNTLYATIHDLAASGAEGDCAYFRRVATANGSMWLLPATVVLQAAITAIS